MSFENLNVPTFLSSLPGTERLSVLVSTSTQTLEWGCGSSVGRSKRHADLGKAFVLLYWKLRGGFIHKKMQDTNYLLSKPHTSLINYIFL